MLGRHGARFVRHIASRHVPFGVGKYLRILPSDLKRYILLEYPKCGRTWLRFMINQAESRAFGIPLINALHGVPYAEFDLPRVRYVHGFQVGIPIKEWNTTVTTGDGEDDRAGVVMLVRDPERVIVSYYFQTVFRDAKFTGSISEFVRDPAFGIEVYVRYLEHYLKALEGQKHMLVTYEGLQADTRSVLGQILQFCGINLSEDAVDEIVRASEFQKMQDFERTGRLNPSWLRPASSDPRALKLRSGGKDRPGDHLSPDDLAFIHEICGASWALKKLGYA